MTTSAADYGWLPDHQLHVVYTLAHVDQLIDHVTRTVHDYSYQDPLTLAEVVDGDRVHIKVTAIAPIPELMPRLVADALTQLRAALEHTLYAEVEHLLQRRLTDQEARSIEMPACTESARFDTWLAHGRRSRLAPLAAGAVLAERIRALQPFQRRDVDDHPLRLLAEHTNLAKHRTPAVAATRLGAVYPDRQHPDLTVALPLKRNPQPGHSLRLQPGDILASSPRNTRTELSIVPPVCLQRPHTGVWTIAIKELGYLEDWIRTTAIPILITGSRQSTPIPPQLDITTGHSDLRRALLSAGAMPAAERGTLSIQATLARRDLPGILSMPPVSADRETIEAWASSLDDATVVGTVARIALVNPDPRALLHYLGELCAEAHAYKSRVGDKSGGQTRSA
ncbi:hypothetical protein OHB41_50430 [Streptomyces sp. NBC_01571]|uniref:hypothetical protein n=1 Tax=Streptomyces sp. NBC_01571 TaxID=2975883 RepID=UPI0022512255|nr:hypothetical protein [Streptomyces sp. NBC_01571]MCX4581179.1 hypothetical protein [Streptomyces sp. NBC_01571]